MKDQENTVQTSLQGIANKAAMQKGYRFRNLYGMLNEELLLDAWRNIRKDAANGVDGVSAAEYEQNLAIFLRSARVARHLSTWPAYISGM